MRSRQKRRLKRTTDSEHAWPIAPNIIDQDYGGGAEPEVGVDISYVWTREEWLYLAVVIDLFSRRVVGWPSATACIATWRWPRCAKPSSCGVRPQGSFIIRTAAAKTAL